MKAFASCARIFLTGVLIVIAWKHSHWSIGLSLLLIMIAIELIVFTLGKIISSLRRLGE